MKKLMAVFAVVLAGIQLSALADGGEYLYWKIEDTVAAESGYSYAQLYYAEAQSMNEGGWFYRPGMDVAEAELSTISSADLSFFVQYYGSDNALLGYSSSYALSDLIANGWVSNTQLNPVVSATGYWAPNFNVPEPTSALLMLFGLSGLALRRRRG